MSLTRRAIGGTVFAIEAGALTSAVLWGRRLQTIHPEIQLGAAPLVGTWRWRTSWTVLPAATAAMVIVAFGPVFAQRMRARTVVVATSMAAVVFALALAASDGAHAILAPVVQPTEYYDNLEALPRAHVLLQWFATRDFLVNYSVHLKGHPPGFILLLKALAAVGLDHPWSTGALSFLGVALLCFGVLTTVRIVADQQMARRVAPFLVISPFAVWLGTSADAFFTGVFAVGVALVAAARAPGRAGLAFAGAGGATLAGALFLTYGAGMLLPLPLVLLWRSRREGRAAALLASALGAAAMFALFRLAGFNWFAGLRTTRGLYWEGTAKFRPWTYFLLGNVAVLVIAVGPAVSAGVVGLRDRRVWMLVAPTLVCLAAANASQYSKGEVERIWLLFMPWLTVSTAALVRTRRWLAVQAATALILQSWLVSKW